jgi:hypothetical protein
MAADENRDDRTTAPPSPNQEPTRSDPAQSEDLNRALEASEGKSVTYVPTGFESPFEGPGGFPVEPINVAPSGEGGGNPEQPSADATPDPPPAASGE